jgi:hypothetical protein
MGQCGGNVAGLLLYVVREVAALRTSRQTLGFQNSCYRRSTFVLATAPPLGVLGEAESRALVAMEAQDHWCLWRFAPSEPRSRIGAGSTP